MIFIVLPVSGFSDCAVSRWGVATSSEFRVSLVSRSWSLRRCRCLRRGLYQIIDLAGGDAVRVGLHDDGEQRLVDPAAALEQGAEERPGRQPVDLQLQVPAVVLTVWVWRAFSARSSPWSTDTGARRSPR